MYGYESNDTVAQWQPGTPAFRADVARWFTVEDLLRMPPVSRQEAHAADPKLFAFVEAADRWPGA